MPDKAIFLDRDDTLIEDLGYISNPDQVKLLPGVPEALIELRAMGYKLVVASNQSAVARGIVTEKVLGQIHDRLNHLLTEKHAYLDRIYYCPFHPEGVVVKYRKENNDRKPNPGMLLTAAKEMDLDLTQSWAIGNSSRDIEAGHRAGCKTILIHRISLYKQPDLIKPKPDYRAVNIKEAVNIIKKHLRSPAKAPSAQKPQSNSASQTSEATPQTLFIESEQAEQPNQTQSAQTETSPSEQNISSNTTEHLLNNILRQLRSMRRDDMFAEFSAIRLIAGGIQVIVLFCLLISIWFLINPTAKDNSVLIPLGFAILLQLMSLTFYTMQRRK
jgi:D-glycero-D-manno-heptose 1,7-bisphosphate phosphatase